MVSKTLEEAIFIQAVEIDSPQKREVYLDEACGDDSQLRARIATLLHEHSQPDMLLDDPNRAVDQIIVQRTDPPKQFGEFEIIREIGRGGMGVVYEAHQSSLNRRVALKVLSVGLGFSDKAIARFKREAEAAARLHHTNIIPVHCTGTADNLPFYAMELVRGPSLDRVIRLLQKEASFGEDASFESGLDHTGQSSDACGGQSEDSDDAVGCQESTVSNDLAATISRTSSLGSGVSYFDNAARMVADVADALDHAHREGVVHRDIKPSNLLLPPDGRLSVNDFGLARILEHPGMTVTGEFLGSPMYMSPEQVSFEAGPIDYRTDIYSLGVTLYELITLRPPFDGRHREQILSQVLHREPRSPRRIDARIPLDLDTICRKAMEKDPKQRYQSAEVMADDLRRFVNRRQISARRIGLLGQAVRWCKRNKAVAALSALLMIALLAGTIAVFSIGRYHARQQEASFQAELKAIDLLLPDSELDALKRLVTLRQSNPDRDELKQLHDRIGTSVLIRSDPSQAEIHVRSADDGQSNWIYLGSTPLPTRLPGGPIYVKLTPESGDDHISLRVVEDGDNEWDILLSAQPNMVRIRSLVANSEYTVPWLRQRPLPPLSEFQVDRCEVTNAEFQGFVDARGYFEKEYWLETLGEDWEETVKTVFVTDRDPTFRGPRFWGNGTFPKTEDNLPVTGVSWYEAMAYAKWAGKRLPTVFHWLRASDFDGWSYRFEVSSRCNIGMRDGAPRETQGPGLRVGGAGVFDMVGNVKEWCINEEVDGARYALGGSWQDDEIAMYDPYSSPAMQRSPDIGFRCARYENDADVAQTIPIQWRAFDFSPGFKPSVEQYRNQFEYARTLPIHLVDEERITHNGLVCRRFQFDTVYESEPMTCFVVLPDEQKFRAPFQTVIAAGPMSLDSKTGIPSFSHADVSRFIHAGRAVVIPLFWSIGGRGPSDFPPYMANDKDRARYTRDMTRIAKDISRTVDFVERYAEVTGRDELNANSLAYCGLSWGGCLGPVWLVGDELATGRKRFKAVILCQTGLIHCNQPPETDQVKYVAWLDTPVLMLNCGRVLWAPYERSQKPMYKLLPLTHGVNKRHIYLPRHTGDIPAVDFDRHANNWLTQWFSGEPHLKKGENGDP